MMHSKDPCVSRLFVVGLFLLSVPHVSALAQDPAGTPEADLSDLWRYLDRDGDGQVSRYEGAEALLLLSEEADQNEDGALSLSEARGFLGDTKREQLAESKQLFEELDRNSDGSLVARELPDEFRSLLSRIDSDGNGEIDLAEFANSDVLENPTLMFENELLGFLEDVDEDGDGAFALNDLPEDMREEFSSEFAELDRNEDGLVSQAELLALVEEEMRGAEFTIRGSIAEMTGVIGPSTPGRVLELILEQPQVKKIHLLDVPGSMDDVSNLRAAKLVRRHGLGTHVPTNGKVASGGTDFFLAGLERSAASGARFGVHSWGSFGEEGADVPRDDPEHDKYLEYYEQMGIPSEFYWFTLDAAPADDIHWMSAEELDEYSFLSPTSSTSDSKDGETERKTSVRARHPLDIDTSGSESGIVPIPKSTPEPIRDHFVKYTKLVAPNGRPIHFFAQAGVENAQLIRAREVMRSLPDRCARHSIRRGQIDGGELHGRPARRVGLLRH